MPRSLGRLVAVLTRFVRVQYDGEARVGRVDADGQVELLDHDEPLRAIRGDGEVVERLDRSDVNLLPPIEAPEIWCAGVTYERSRDARVEESRTDARDVYALVYDADRPELFMKDAQMRRTVGPDGPIRVRRDSSWTVPEPELGVVLGDSGEPVAVTAGNDVSSRDIEGANPLYVPQAKIFAGSCAIGPALAVPADWTTPFVIRLRITSAAGDELFAGETSTARMRRSPHELAAWAVRDNPIPPGSVLLTGTGLVPPDEYALEPGHTVSIEIPGIGELVNTVAPQ
jgi:2-dehydro-3-deoxy-D-arabinonate dehydratase